MGRTGKNEADRDRTRGVDIVTIARLHAIRRMLLTLLAWVEEDLRARGWQRGHGDASTTDGRRV